MPTMPPTQPSVAPFVHAEPWLGHDSVEFATRAGTLQTQGVYARLTTPAGQAWAAESELQREITAAMRSAQAAGIAQPVVVGSLPFAGDRSGCLIIPKAYRFVTPPPRAHRPVLPQSRADLLQLARTADGRQAFVEAVQSLLALFESGAVQKVVLARVLDIPLPAPVESRALLDWLRRLSPRAYAFLVPLTPDQVLVGVSPELLLRKQGVRIFSNPLAGSVARARCRRAVDADRYFQASSKDQLEHRLVVDEVQRRLAPYCSVLKVPGAPSLLGTAALWHLSTKIEGRLADPGVNSLRLACALHPTPAVCGWPVEPAQAALARIESFDRGFFTGLTGYMDAAGDGEWAVSIRCGVFSPDAARLYAGAGIVRGSVAEQEWDETAVKLGPMLAALHAVAGEGSLCQNP